MKNMKIVLLSLVGLAAFSGCSIDANLGQISDIVPSLDIFQKSTGTEFVSGSTQFEVTPVLGYKVQVSVGSYLGSVKTVTPGGYTVYSSVQGAMLSDSQ